MNNWTIIENYLQLAKLGRREEGTALYFHEDFTVVEADTLPYAGTYRGAKGFMQLIGKVMGEWSNLEIETLQVVGAPDGDVFAIEMSMKGASTKSGRPFSTTVCELWTIKDHKIFAIKPYYWDTKKMVDLAQD